jgi:hypothetical protein
MEVIGGEESAEVKNGARRPRAAVAVILGRLLRA